MMKMDIMRLELGVMRQLSSYMEWPTCTRGNS